MSWWENSPVADSSGGNDRVNQFVTTYRPIAERIGQEIGVSPDILLAKFGNETGWGKSIIPGTNNLGNIKAPSGNGVVATDNMTGSRDAYRRFESPEQFADYYADFIKRSYPKAVGAGSDAAVFAAGLKEGVRGSYAEDPAYATKIQRASSMVTGGKAPAAANAWWESAPLADAAPASNSGGDNWWQAAPLAEEPKTAAPAPQATPAAPKEAPKAPAVPQRSVAGNLGLGTRNVLEGLEQGFTFPVRAAGEFASGALGLLGQRELADKVSRTVGMKNPGAGALAADTLGLAKPETKTEKAVAEGTKAAAGLATGTVVNKLAEKAPQAVKGALSILMPGTGGSAREVAKDVAVYGGLGASMEAAPAETAAGLAVLAAGKAGVGKVMTNRAADKIVSKAGTREGGQIDAEVIKDLAKAAGNGNRRDADLMVGAINDVGNRYVGEVLNAVKRVEPSLLKTIDVQDVLLGKKTVTGDDLMKIMGSDSGNALAAAITKYQRLNSLTQQTHASEALGALAARGMFTAAPAAVGGAVGGVPGAILGGMVAPKAEKFAQMATGKADRADVVRKLLKKEGAADEVLRRFGASQASQDISLVRTLAREAEQKALATKAAAAAEQKAALEAGNLLKTANKDMGIKPRPMKMEKVGGGTNAVLQYHTGLGPDELNKGLGMIANEMPDLAPFMKKLANNETVGSRAILTQTTDRLLHMKEKGLLSAATEAASAAAPVAKVPGKSNPISQMVRKLSDDEVAALAGRSTDTMGVKIDNLRGYLTKRASEANRLYKTSPDKLPPEDIDLLRRFGLAK